MTRSWRSAQFVVLAVALLAAISMELRIAIAAAYLKRRTIPATLRAAWLVPADERVFLQLARLNAERRALYLRDAAERNPDDAAPLLELGLMAQMTNNLNEAEEDFERAAQLDVRVDPSWALANFYFQQDNQEKFRYWGDRYRAFAAGNAVGLFRMEWSRSHSVSRLLESFRPLGCEELTGMATFLDSRATALEAMPVDELLASCPGYEASKAVMTDVSRLLAADHSDAALKLWNGLSRNRVFPYTPLDPFHGPTLTNADFAYALDELGFNWRINRTPGVSVRRLSHSLELRFDGKEPEASTLLFEPVVLQAGANYQLDCRIDSENASEAGFGWRLVELGTGSTVANGIEGKGHRPDDALSWTFRAPKTLKTTVIAFSYVRPAGSIRAQGKIILSDVTLRAIEDKRPSSHSLQIDNAYLARTTSFE